MELTQVAPSAAITVGRFDHSHRSTVMRVYREFMNPRDARDADKVYSLGVGESKRVLEWSNNIPFTRVHFPLPCRITNVDGQLVKTVWRKP